MKIIFWFLFFICVFTGNIIGAIISLIGVSINRGKK